LQPLFSIERVESYQEFGTLYLVGEIKNVSGSLKSNVELTAILFDGNKQELQRETIGLSLKGRSLLPNESTLLRFPSIAQYPELNHTG